MSSARARTFEQIDNLTREPTYVVGVPDERTDKALPRKRGAPMVLVTYTPTNKGYRQRCADPRVTGLDNDFVSGETMRDLHQWFVVDFGSRFKLFDSRKEAEAYLNQHAPHV